MFLERYGRRTSQGMYKSVKTGANKEVNKISSKTGRCDSYEAHTCLLFTFFSAPRKSHPSLPSFLNTVHRRTPLASEFLAQFPGLLAYLERFSGCPYNGDSRQHMLPRLVCFLLCLVMDQNNFRMVFPRETVPVTASSPGTDLDLRCPMSPSRYNVS
jgi:hypothetical protein